jgi:hypothetical protein
MRRDDAAKIVAKMAFNSSHIESVRLKNLHAMALNKRVPLSPLISYQKRIKRYYKSCVHELYVLIDMEKKNNGQINDHN